MKKEDIQTKINELKKLINNPNLPKSDKKNLREGLKQYEEKLAMQEKEMAKPTPKAPARKPTPARKPAPTRKTTARKPAPARRTTTTTTTTAVETTPTRKTPTRKPIARKTTTSAVKPTTTRKTTAVKPKTTPKTIAGKVSAKKMPKGVTMISKKKVLVNGVEMNTDSQEFCDYLTAEFIKRKEQAKKNKTTRTKTKSVMAQVSSKIEQGVEKAIKTGIAKQKPALAKNPNVFIGKVEKLESATKNFLQQLKEVLGNDYDAKEVTETTKAIQKLISDLKDKYNK